MVSRYHLFKCRERAGCHVFDSFVREHLVSTRHWALTAALIIFAIAGPVALSADDAEFDSLMDQYESYSGSTIVFQRDELPTGRYHDVMKPLSNERRVKAIEVCLAEVQRYPPRYFAKLGLKTIGVFEACASKRNDGFHTYDPSLGGYRYYGVYNGSDAFVTSFYSEAQLARTFHHEVFHHVDSTVNGVTDSWQLSADDAYYRAAISGAQRYSKPAVTVQDVERLRKLRRGGTMRHAASSYASKNPREDQAETARHLMTKPAASLVQVMEKPELPGSQRILHTLGEYRKSIPNGPGIDWFLKVALEQTDMQIAQRLRDRLATFVKQDRRGVSQARYHPEEVRQCLAELALLDGTYVPLGLRKQLVRLASQTTRELIVQRIDPGPKQNHFVVFGTEDTDGANWTLRGDIAAFRLDAARLSRIAMLDPTIAGEVSRAQLSNLRLLARYYLFIRLNWRVTQETTRVFELARATYSSSLHLDPASLRRLRSARFSDLSRDLSPSGDWITP